MKKQPLLLIVMMALVAGLLLSNLFRSCGPPGHTGSTVIPADSLRKQMNDAQEKFRVTIDSVNNKTLMLTSELNTLQEQLNNTKKKNTRLQAVLLDQSENTNMNSNDCDSLRTVAQEWVLVSKEKDSLYEAVISNQDTQLQNKDAVIVLQQQQRKTLLSSFEQSLQQQQLLETQTRQWEKQFRREKRKNWWLTGFALIAAGVTTSYLLNH